MKSPKRSSPSGDKLYLILRAGWWHYRRRVPKRFRALDGQDFAAAATGCREHEYAQAVAVARELNATTEHRWQMLAEGLEPSAIEVAYAKAVDRARTLGFTYRHRDTLIAGDTGQLVERILEMKALGLSRTPAAVEAIMGTAEQPQLMLSQLHLRYFESTPDRQEKHAPRTNANWRNRRRKAVEMALEAIGDKPLRDVTRTDALTLRKGLYDAATAGKFQKSYVNKVFGCLSSMFREISDQGQMELVDPFGGLRLSNAGEEQRLPFDSEHVRSVLLGPPR